MGGRGISTNPQPGDRMGVCTSAAGVFTSRAISKKFSSCRPFNSIQYIYITDAVSMLGDI
jgi:hypothetical protein